ncbi:MAG: cupin domain-containing protein [Planctomycetes bacterium]|nr:cupin domain-containing protein [Planctomycetota bacterium]
MGGKFILGATAETQEFDWGFFRWISRPSTTGAKSLVVCGVHVYPGKGHNFHRHPEQEEVIHVLDGEMEQWVGREKRVLGPGDSVFIPRDAVHASFTIGKRTLKVVAILGPCAGPEGYQLIDVSGEEPWASLRK